MKVQTTRFGEIDCRPDAILTFPNGIIGFPTAKRFVILDHDRDAPIKWLQSVDQGHLAFVVMDPTLFKADYQVQITPDAVMELDYRDKDDLALMVILTIPSSNPSTITANLRGPVVVNSRTRLAKQLVLNEDLPTRHHLFPEQTPHAAPVEVPEPVGAGGR
jgi:flagellar assembly factor FliW